ncbi:hypothetical protein [Streptomyces sp. NPDC059460]|uniref:hypothetical protein n=1 Tax=Streptomyces sp. NPDC059460 TaxID=3346840 RepID=UPI0036A9CBA5
MPLLFIEVDNCHETAEEIADKLEKYARFFRRKVKDTDSKERPMWRTRWTVPEGRPSDVPHPAVLLVFNRIGDRNPDRTIPRLIELTRNLWEGERFEDHHLYDGKIPVVAIRLRNLREHRPGRAGVPPIRPRPHAVPAGGDRQPSPRGGRRTQAGRVRGPRAGSARSSCSAWQRSTGPSGRPAVRCVPTADSAAARLNAPADPATPLCRVCGATAVCSGVARIRAGRTRVRISSLCWTTPRSRICWLGCA